jgi:hypothetical protein
MDPTALWPLDAENAESESAEPAHSRGLTGSLSSASTPKAHSWARGSVSLPTKRSSHSIPREITALYGRAGV